MDSIKEIQEAIRAYQKLSEAVVKARRDLGMDHLAGQISDLENQMAAPGFWDDPDKAAGISQKKSALEGTLGPWDELTTKATDNLELLQMAAEENDLEAAAGLDDELTELEELFEQLELMGSLTEAEDAFNAFINIHPGAGGTESQDWAEMLYRMYLRWFESKGWGVDVLDQQPGEQAGMKNVTLLVKGTNAFGLLKSENGIHRLVRLSPFDSAKRRHTSFVSIHVSPELPDDMLDIDINETDLRIDTYRSSGAGGQHVNTTDSAVRITHVPTGIVVQCQNERSQIKNRGTAMKMLKSRLQELEMAKRESEAEEKSGEKKDIAWGSQIRSYVFHPYNMVKDHRTGYETGNVADVMNGNLEPFIMAYLKNLSKVDA